MSQLKPREHFVEDIETYDNPPFIAKPTTAKNNIQQNFTEQEDSLQKLRYWLFDFLSQNIDSKSNRNNIYDVVSQETVISKLLPMNLEDRTKLVKEYISESFVPEVNATAVDTNTLDQPIVAKTNTTVEVANATMPGISDHFVPDVLNLNVDNKTTLDNNIGTKLDKVINNLNDVTSGLTDIKNMVTKSPIKSPEPSPVKEPYVPVIPPAFQLPKTAPFMDKKTESIEGFENVRQFANY